MAESLRFAIIGAGVIGPTHAQAIARLPEARLVAVADVQRERARTLAEQYGARAYEEAGKMLEAEQPDVVCVCTPSGMHGADGCLAMRAGAHVLIEKPMAISHADISDLLRVRQETGRKLAVVSQHRWDPATLTVRRMLDEGALGRVVLGNVQVPWWRSQAYYESGGWRGTWAMDGGGVLMNQGIHAIDLLTWLMGPVVRLHAYTDTLAHRMETEDVAVAVLRFANGALGTIAATTAAYPGVTTRVEIFGDRGSAVIENDRLGFLHLARDDAAEPGPYGIAPSARQSAPAAEGTAQNPGALIADTHALQIADLIRAIREDGTPLIDGQAGRHPVEVILGIYESARSGKEVVL